MKVRASIAAVAALIAATGFGVYTTLAPPVVRAAAPTQSKSQELAEQLSTATIVTSCNQIIVVVLTNKDGQTLVIDETSGVDADYLKSVIQASNAQIQVYEVGCYSMTEPGIMT
jgi:anti-sigma factor RsiW